MFNDFIYINATVCFYNNFLFFYIVWATRMNYWDHNEMHSIFNDTPGAHDLDIKPKHLSYFMEYHFKRDNHARNTMVLDDNGIFISKRGILLVGKLTRLWEFIISSHLLFFYFRRILIKTLNFVCYLVFYWVTGYSQYLRIELHLL